jgi:hypothetical protein
MADSILLRTGEQAPELAKGHGTGALGPSDSSDSGSDIQGGPGIVEEAELGLDRGPSDDPGGGLHSSAGPDVGDFNLDSDSDRNGTGERLGAGRDDLRAEAADIYPDHEEHPTGGEIDSPTQGQLVEEIESTPDNEGSGDPLPSRPHR